MRLDIFDRMIWKSDRMMLGDLVFRLQHFKNNDWSVDEEFFLFFKIKPLVDQYNKFFSRLQKVGLENVFELGIFDGGSVVFWFEILQPLRHVAIDIQDRGDSDYFKKYIKNENLGRRIYTHWRVDQAAKSELRRIVQGAFDGPLDLVIDDASHLYGPTKASFEALFPLLRPGGLYIIEDWAWYHWKEYHTPGNQFIYEKPLTDLVVELIEATGSSKTFISNVTVFEGFAVVERGTGLIEKSDNFKLSDHIVRAPKPPLYERVNRNIRERLKWLIGTSG